MTISPSLLRARGGADPGVTVETVDLPRPPGPVDLCRSGPAGRRLWIVGLPVSLHQPLDRLLESAVSDDPASARRALTSLDGAFAAFLWDEAAGRLLVVNDFAGFQPLYMRRETGTIAFAPRIDALAGDAPDPTGWGAFVGYGAFVGARTSVAGVTRVAPGQVLEYDAAADRLQAETYWQWPEVDSRATLETVDTGELLARIEQSLFAYDVYGTAPTLLLSGGFESRLLAALLARAGRRPAALTLRNPYEHLEIEGRFASRVARLLDLPHTVRDPDPDFFSTPRYLEYVRDHEVAAPSVNLFIAQIASELRAAGVQASCDGVPFGAVLKAKPGRSFAELVARTMKPFDGPAWQAARQVFAPRFQEAMREGFERAVADEIAACHDAPHGIRQFTSRNRTRHRIALNPLKVYSRFSLQYLVGLTRPLYEGFVPLPLSVTQGEAVYLRIFERHFPELARIPWCTAGNLMPGTERRLGYRALAARSAVIRHPRLGRLLKRTGLAPSRPQPACVDDAVRRAALDDEWLNADGIRGLQQTAPSGTNADTFARELVFYWTMWRRIMSPGARGAASAELGAAAAETR